jgi:HlyD family secretion protein
MSSLPSPDHAPPVGGRGMALVRGYQSEAAARRYAAEPVPSRIAIWLLAGTLLSLVAISTIFTIDRVVVSQYGQVVTTQPTTVLQSLDPSIIRSIDVIGGQRVRAGQVLATLDPTFAAADVTALETQIASLQAVIDRAEAELAHRPYVAPVTGNPVVDAYARLQQQYYLERQQQFTAQAHGFDEQIQQSRAAIAGFTADAAMYGERIAVARTVEGMRQKLQAMSLGTALDTLTALDDTLEVTRSLQADEASIAENRHEMAAASDSRQAFIQEWLGTTTEELVTTRDTLDTAETELNKARRHRDLVRIVAPEDAVVLSIAPLSVGSVLKEGDTLVTLASLRSPMQGDIDIAARDIGFVRPGDPVTVKFDAFQFVEHGAAKGRVLSISDGTFTADPITGTSEDSNGRGTSPYYKAKIGFTEVRLRNVPPDFRLIPGMTLTADIHVGQRSVFMYLVRGLVRGVDEAMREP